jgi:hypothetical protein
MGTHNSLLDRFDLAEYRLCRSLNRGVAYPVVRHFFKYASRLGDGVVWYVLMVALPLVSWQACAAFPELTPVLVPLALAIAASRVVLGLHYPTDVLVGALIGATFAAVGVAVL